MRVLSFGGGTDSTAILCGWVERDLQKTEPIDHVFMADTGNEHPHTYAHVERMSDWNEKHGLPRITVIRKGGRQETLEESCLRLGVLPAIAYGRKTCSQKFKIEPAEKHMNSHPAARAVWAGGGKVEKMIGFEFSERRRWAASPMEDGKYRMRFPLVEWEWSRPECVAAIARAGLPQPGKSSCFFCPSMKKTEIRALKEAYPVLFHRALRLEATAISSPKWRPDTRPLGLGRGFAWRDFEHTTADAEVAPCMVCVDETEDVPQTLQDIL